MFENIMNFFKKLNKKETKVASNSKEAAKERLHLVLMQDRANVSADFLDMMRQEIIEVIKKYIDVDEKDIDVRLTNKTNEDGTTGAPALYANIPIAGIREEMKKEKNIEKETKEALMLAKKEADEAKAVKDSAIERAKQAKEAEIIALAAAKEAEKAEKEAAKKAEEARIACIKIDENAKKKLAELKKMEEKQGE